MLEAMKTRLQDEHAQADAFALKQTMRKTARALPDRG